MVVGRSFRRDNNLSGLPDHALLSIIRIPEAAKISPWWLMLRRVVYALLLTLVVTLIVYFDREATPRNSPSWTPSTTQPCH